MITCITGLPGHGKTLYALTYIKALAEKTGRDVYQSGINECALPWTEFKSEEWMTLPPGAIILIDEAQDTFPKRPNGSKLPEFYTDLAKHRHHGFDIFLITQHPSLLDNFVRKLVGQHLHCIRKFGLSRSTIWEWSAANVMPERPSSHKSAISRKWKFPKSSFAFYKSAELHTVKRAIPFKIILAALFIVVVLSFAFYVFKRFQARTVKQPDAVPAAMVGAASAGGVAGAPGHSSYTDAVADAKQFVFDRTERVSGLPYTAPRYDQITKPTSAPVPAACVHRGNRCDCYTQQATPMAVSFNLCLEIVHHGYFLDFNPDGDKAVKPSVLPLAAPPAPVSPAVASVAPAPVSDRVSVIAVASDHSKNSSQ